MLVKRKQTNKFMTPFDPNPYRIVDVKGSMITAQNSIRKTTRNSSFFSKIDIQEKSKARNGFKSTSDKSNAITGIEIEFQFHLENELDDLERST